jgi:predicted metalloprotease with PDZ domain
VISRNYFLPRPPCRLHAILASLVLCLAAASAVSQSALRVEVDAREIWRQLLHATIEIPVVPGKLALWYPKWIPGVHAPGGPIQNMAGFRLETPEGKPVLWERDPVEPFRFTCTVPEGTERLVARLDYICNQPTANSSGVDSFGNSHVGVINWNTGLVYPEGPSIDELSVNCRVRLPLGWRFGTALKQLTNTNDTVSFATETLRHFVDKPLVAGEHFRTIDLHPANMPPAFIHLTSESPSAIQPDDQLIGQYSNLLAQAGAMFGGAHFPEYHFLVVCSDQLPRNGLEHLSSSFNVVGERDLVDDKKRKDWPAYLLPHEFVHSWCGKYRRPAGMVTPNFHTPEQTGLLWVYEGLAQYLGEVLTVRSGLVGTNDYIEWLGGTINYLMHQVGRRWRPLEDTATSSYLLRGQSPSWGHLRRNQDYYDEGLLLWLEADAIIREQSDGKRSMDDFCRKFMGPNAKRAADLKLGQPVDVTAAVLAPYERDDVVRLLDELAKHDWSKFIRERVDLPQEELSVEVVGRLGYRLQYDTKPPERLEERERERKYVSALDSLGINVSNEGKITAVVPGLPADKAGLAPGMIVQGVNDRKFAPQRLKDAIADSVMKRKVEFLVLQGDTFRNVVVPYSDGLKYLKLVRDPEKPDRLAQITKPK